MADQEKTKNEASQTANQKRPLDESELEQIVGGGDGEQEQSGVEVTGQASFNSDGITNTGRLPTVPREDNTQE